jgi:hypothetical protein
MDTKLARNAMKVHHFAASLHEGALPDIARASMIKAWKMMNNTERDISMSQGWETAVFGYEDDIELF